MNVKGPVGHRQRQAEETKNQVARAARRLFGERGFHATTVAAISEAADIPEQTIYSALGSKTRILERITGADDRTPNVIAFYAQQLPEGALAKVRESVDNQKGEVGPGWVVNALKDEAKEAA